MTAKVDPNTRNIKEYRVGIKLAFGVEEIIIIQCIFLNHHLAILEKADYVRNELETRILEGIDLCGSAMNEGNQTIAFIKFIASTSY